MLKDSRQREKKKKKKEREKKYGSEEEDEDEEDPESSSESSSDEDDEVVHRSKKAKRAAVSSDSDSDLEADDVDKVMDRLPDNPMPLLDFANASQGILLLLVLKQHLKNLYGFSDRYPSHTHPAPNAIFFFSPIFSRPGYLHACFNNFTEFGKKKKNTITQVSLI